MALYDIRLIQNLSVSGVEFYEQIVNIAKGGLLTANASGVPVVLPAGTNDHILYADSASAYGIKWAAAPTTHDQNTDTGTTQTSFQIDSGNDGGRIKHLGSGKLGVRNVGDSDYVDFQAKRGSFTYVTLPNDPVAGTDAANRDWVLAQITAQAALQFKGTIGSAASDTITIADFNALQTYSVGWLYVVNEAGTIRGISASVGDWFIAAVERTGSGSQDSDWTHIAFDTSDFVTGPATTISTEAITIWDSNNRKIKSSGVLISDLATTSDLNDYIPKSLILEHGMIRGKTDGVPENFVVAPSRIVGRASTGTVRDLLASEVRTIINVEDGANNYTHPSQSAINQTLTGANVFDTIQVNTLGHVTSVGSRALTAADIDAMNNWVSVPATNSAAGTAGDLAHDSNYIYLCVTTGTTGNAKWIRFAGALWV